MIPEPAARRTAAVDPAWLDLPGPLHLDLGCARGTFLCRLALLHPEWKVLGVERLTERVQRCKGKIQRLGLTNAAVVQGKMPELLHELLPASSVSWIHALFPDPWPKRRHAPRRLIQESIFPEFARLLVPGGKVRFLTDQKSYWQDSLEVLGKLENWVLENDDPVGDWPASRFQSRFEMTGHPIYGWIAGPKPDRL